jgi:hypothetical protein
MSRDEDFDDDIDGMEDLDELIEHQESHPTGRSSARRKIEELREMQRLRHLLDNDYPDL